MKVKVLHGSNTAGMAAGIKSLLCLFEIPQRQKVRKFRLSIFHYYQIENIWVFVFDLD